ncbi:MAG: hypothetical protein Q7N50_07185 [Armatimonadota bacterium]|nr:hypothetical protein [Armatimonadota bacterium]
MQIQMALDMMSRAILYTRLVSGFPFRYAPFKSRNTGTLDSLGSLGS